jgi:hypothetical protein
VYWYHPAWSNPAEDPVAISIASGQDLVELKEAVSHEIQGNSLKIYAFFTDEPLSVRSVEKTITSEKRPPEGSRVVETLVIER